MGRFNLANYTEVKDRIPLFLAEYPEGRIVTTIIHMDFEATPAVCVVRAELYRDHDATQPMATGLAYEREAGPVNKTSFVENCETSAIGRACGNANFTGNSQKPSRQEMEKVERVEAEIEKLIDEVMALARTSEDEKAKQRAREVIEAEDVNGLRAAIAYFKQQQKGDA